MTKQQKTYEPSEYKAIPALGLTITDEDKGIVEHLISVFGVTDLGGDICHPGAFTKTLQERADRIRVLDAHQRNSVLNAIGVPLQLKEVSREELPAKVLEQWPEATGGLWAETRFLLDTPEGKGAFARIKAGAVKEFSFGYNTLDADYTEDQEGVETRHLRTIKLWEYGPVLFGMNPAAGITGVKKTPPDPPPVSKDSEIQDKKESDGIVPEPYTTKLLQFIKEKALSYTRMESLVREAFNDEYNPSEGLYDYWVKEVYDEYVIVEASKARECYQVPYALKNGDVMFSSKGEWVVGEFVFVEKREEADKRLLQLVEIEQEQFELALEAGPD